MSAELQRNQEKKYLNIRVNQLQADDGLFLPRWCGVETLVAGTVTVTNSNYSQGDVVILSHIGQNGGPHPVGTLTVANPVDGVSFDIQSVDSAGAVVAGDVSDVAYLLVKS